MEKERVESYPRRYPGFQRNSIDPKKIDDSNFYKNDQLCEFDIWVDPSMVKILPKDSVSPTFQSIVKLNSTPKQLLSMTANKKVFIKAFPTSFSESAWGEKTNALVREIAIHRYLSYLSKYQVTPCIQRYFADFICSTKEYGVSKIFSSKVSSMDFWTGSDGKVLHTKEKREFERDKKIHYVLSEYIEGKTLYTWLLEGKFSLEDFKSILFQVLYTTWQFHLAGIRHNDLHLKNIFIRPSETKKPLSFLIDKKFVTVSGNYIAKIIDFDRAGFYAGYPIKNIYPEDQCRNFGICLDGRNRSFDAVKVVSDVYQFIGNSPADCREFYERFINKISQNPLEMIKKSKSVYKRRWAGTLCIIPPENGDCQNWEPPERLFKFFPSMVNSDDFELGFVETTARNINQVAQTYSEYPDKFYASLDTDPSLLDFLDSEKTKLLKKMEEDKMEL